MTMTSVALAPGSLLTANMYHLQQGFGSTSNSPTPTSNYETVSKGKKSWSVRLGLSRQAQNAQTDEQGRGWNTISGNIGLSRQMIYGEPWLYGTVRSSRPAHESRPFLTPPPPPPPGTPLLLVCSCPEFLTGTARKLGNCRKCGGHRLAGVPLGGTCRLPPSSSRSRPSLAGVLRPALDDPYDQMRRNRLVEPRTRARSISPHRPFSQRDSRSQSQTTRKERKGSIESTFRSEWLFEKEANVKSRPNHGAAPVEEWLEENSSENQPRNHVGRLVRTIPKKAKSGSSRNDWLDSPSDISRRKSGQQQQPPQQHQQQQQQQQQQWSETTKSINATATTSTTGANSVASALLDSRRSILECDVNPYLLVKKQKDEDDLSDDLSDNALEQEDGRPLSSLFDPSKVKSIERIPNRAAVAAIGGQRIRVFNEPREISDDEEIPPVTRIPIPKVSPKRPPRRLKEARQTLKSILKRGKVIEAKRKNVLFNVDNVIFAPEKPSEVTRLSWSRLGRMSNCLPRKDRKGPKDSEDDEREEADEAKEQEKDEAQERTMNVEPIAPQDQREKYNFITVPNIRDPKAGRIRLKELRRPDEKSYVLSDTLPKTEKLTRSDNQTACSRKPISSAVTSEEITARPSIKQRNDPIKERNEESEERIELRTKLDEPLRNQHPRIVVDEKDMILKFEDSSKRSSLTRSQSDRSFSRPEVLAGDVLFSDTMRLSLCRKTKDPISSLSQKDCSGIIEAGEENGNGVDTVPSGTECSISESREESRKTDAACSKETMSPVDVRNDLDSDIDHFRRMRATSWSPPPGRQACQLDENETETKTYEIEDTPSSLTGTWTTSTSCGSSTIEIGCPSKSKKNVCKITVSPCASPLVHRLQIGPGTRRTSILIGSDSTTESTPNNKVTISVGGEDSICNPTVISVNSEDPPRIQNSVENRTLVILDNFKSNIVVESEGKPKFGMESTNTEESTTMGRVELRADPKNQTAIRECNKVSTFSERSSQNEPESSLKLSSGTSKEALISKLLEDSLRKARENGEIVDEDSGEAILKILKQSLLKSNEYESSESTLEPGYSRSSSLNSETDFVSTNLFLEENPYEVIKEPIYEEIPDEPPPLPLSPPPTEDYIKDRIYFGDVGYYSKVDTNQFLESYLTEHVFKKSASEDLTESYLSKSPEDFFKKMSRSPEEENISSKFELLNFLMDSKNRTVPVGEEEEEDDEDEDEDDTEGDLEALYEQKETSLGDLSSKSSQISNISDSSEECNIILANSSDTSKVRAVDIERTDSGVGSESSQASSSRGVPRRWRTGNVSSGQGSLLGGVPQVISGDSKLCEDCEQRLDPLITDSGVVYAPFVCRKCSKKRIERKEIITEIVETEQKYGRDLQIILEEFHRPMLRAGLLTSEQLTAIFLNVEELLEHNLLLAEKLKDAVEFAQESGDEDLITVDVGKIFLESERMLHAFENYCIRQGSASVLLQNLEKEKELLRIFLKVSQMENTVLRRMNLNSFLMVPVQRVTKYPLLLARLLKATPSVRPDIQEAKKRLKQAQTNIELHLEHMNAEAKDVTSTKLWRRISIIQNGRRSTGEQDMVNIKLRKMAVEILEWAHEEAKFVLEGRLLVAQPTDNNWRRGRTVKLAPVTAMLVTNGKPNAKDLEYTDDSLFPRHIGLKEATLLLVKEKLGRYSLLREPLYLDKCIVCCETDLEDYFEVQELSSKETFIFKAEDGARTKRWCRTLQVHAQSLGAWRRRRGALPNIMICGVTRN